MSTKVDNYGAIGWKPQQPYVISGADFKLYSDDTGHIGMPVELDTAHGTTGVDTADQNKRWVQPYSATDGTNVCLGVMFKELPAKGNANERRLGLGGYRRDIALLQFGIVPMLNVGSTTVTMSTRVAPLYNATDSLSGFGEWSEGMKILGYCFQAEIPAGHWGWIFVTAEATPANSADLDDLTSVTITGPGVDGDILVYDTDGWVDVPLTISLITDTTITGPYTDGDILIYDTDAFKDVPLTVSLITDTTITGPYEDGDVLIYDTDAFKDVPLTLGLATDYTETSVASGQALIYDGSGWVNATLITELVALSDDGTNYSGTMTGTPLTMVSVFASGADKVPDVQLTYDATATVPTLTYNWTTTTISTNKATDAYSHVMVTYWYDENA